MGLIRRLPTRKALGNAVPWILAVGLCGVNILLVRQNLGLRSQIEASRTAAFQAGYKVPPLSGFNRNGDEVTITLPETANRVLVLFFSPSCRFCDRQFPFWGDLIRLKPAIPILGVVAQGVEPPTVEQYLRRFGAGSLELLFADEETLRAYRLTNTPTTLVVSRQGSVEEGWIGVLTKDAQRDVRRLVSKSSQ